MKKNIKILLLAMTLPLVFINPSCSEEVQATNLTMPSAALVSPDVGVSDKSVPTEPKLVAPVVEEPSVAAPTVEKKQAKTKKIDLSAVIFDPNADFKARAEEEGREMTKLEDVQYDLHEALHGEVKSMNAMSKKGLLSDYLTAKPERGPLESINLWGVYRGYLTNSWVGEDYKNTLFTTDSLFAVIDGKFKDKKTSFRSMFLLGEGKEGHDFFNDVWGDQYIMYSWSKQDQLLFGYSRNSVGLEGSESPTTLPFIGRSQIAKSYNNVRALGAKAQGSHKLYDYNVGIFSSGRYFLDWFPGPEFVGAVGIKPLGLTDGRYGKLLLGGGLNAGNAESHYVVGSAYADYEYKRLKATLEYGSADGSNGSTGFTTNQSEGIAGTLAYRITPKLQILGRYDQFDPNKNKANDIRREYTAGINYFLKEQSLKLMLNYTIYSVENGTYGSKILVGTQIIL